MVQSLWFSSLRSLIIFSYLSGTSTVPSWVFVDIIPSRESLCFDPSSLHESSGMCGVLNASISYLEMLMVLHSQQCARVRSSLVGRPGIISSPLIHLASLNSIIILFKALIHKGSGLVSGDFKIHDN